MTKKPLRCTLQQLLNFMSVPRRYQNGIAILNYNLNATLSRTA